MKDKYNKKILLFDVKSDLRIFTAAFMKTTSTSEID